MAKTLTVDIKAQNQELKRKLRESQAYIKELEKTAKNSTKGVSGSFNGAKSSVSRFTQECKDAGKSISDAFSNLKSGNLEGAVSSLKGISGAAAGAAAGVAAIGTVAVMAGSKIADLVGEGIELAQQAEGIKHRFEEIGGTSIYLESLRQHTHGLVNDLELMKATVKANDFHIPMKDLGTYLEFAQLKAQQTGESVDYLVDSIVTGLGRQSVQILDNLGISAAELKSKMAEGKTMTEAVAEVINKQLSEAGEHFETTAEKAQRKLVELQNEEMRVGEQLAPLKSDWESFLTSVEIWAMKAVAKVAALFSEAQRIKNLESDMESSSTGSGAQLEAYKRRGTKEQRTQYRKYRENEYNKRINELSGQIYQLEHNKNAAYNVSKANELKERRQALRNQRDKFLAGANNYEKSLYKPIVTSTPTGGGRRGSVGHTTTTTADKTPLEKLKEKTNKVDYSKFATTDENRTEEVELPFKVYAKETTAEDIKAELEQFAPKDPLEVEVKPKVNQDETKKTFKDLAGEIEDFGNSLGSIGSSLGQAFEAPEMDVAGMIAQAIGSLTLQFATVPKGATVWEWIVATAAGVATLVATIASIKSATSGYANGGIIGGSSMSGDNMLARVNSGEMILNGKQQNNLFHMLNNGESGIGGNVHFVLRGSDLYGSMRNYSKTKAMTGKNTGIK